MINLSPSLNQGIKFNKYQSKIENSLETSSSNVEGFTQMDSDSLTKQTNNVIDKYSQTQNIDQLKQEYNNTLKEYENLVAKINGSVTGYIDRVNPNNQYLGKNIVIGTNTMYVTKQGVAKWYPTQDILTATTGKNGCPAQQTVIKVNLLWKKDYETSGATIPTTPSLITGTPMTSGQSCGNEGTNIYVDKLMNNPTVTYKGCFADNTSSPILQFIGGAPPSISSVNIQNGKFSQPELTEIKLLDGASSLTGWTITDGAWLIPQSQVATNSIPIPFPNGAQCLVMMAQQSIYQQITLNPSVTYNISINAVVSHIFPNVANNPIKITISTLANNTGSSVTVGTITPSDLWNEYKFQFNVNSIINTTTGLYLNLIGTLDDFSFTAIQNIKITTGNDSSPSFSYEQCKNASIDGGYQYFALQDVNNTTSLGYCAVSAANNGNPLATNLGPALTPGGLNPLWASNTSGQSGNSATLTVSGTLSVLNTSGQSVFTTTNKNKTPPGYVGCYTDNANRAMSSTVLSDNTIGNPNGPYNWGMNTASCKQAATNNNYQYYSIQAGSVCFLSNDLNQTTQYGKAGNCSGSGDNIVGGGWANAVYSAQTPPSNYFLILQDDGNMVIYKGTGPSDNQGVIWATGTNGKAKDANPVYAAANGKYAQNWISSGSTLAAGDFVGSTSGNMALIMQSDGNLVLYAFTMVSNCKKMADGNMGGGVGALPLYDIGTVGYPSNMSKLAYIDQNSELHSYSSENIKYTNNYTKIPGNDSPGNDISGASFANATIESCISKCNTIPECAGFTFSNNVCYPKTSAMYPSGKKQFNSNFDLYVRNKSPLSPPVGVPKTVINTDSIMYQNYVDGGKFENKYGISQATSVQKSQLEQLQTKMDLLSNQIISMTNKYQSGTEDVGKQSIKNVNGISNHLTNLTKTNVNIVKVSGDNSNGLNNIVKDSDIVVLQKNYDYLFWSILAAGSVLVSMNIMKSQ